MSTQAVSTAISIEEITVKNNQALEKIVVGEIAKIEGGLTVIGCLIPINGHATVDILCHDLKKKKLNFNFLSFTPLHFPKGRLFHD